MNEAPRPVGDVQFQQTRDPYRENEVKGNRAKRHVDAFVVRRHWNDGGDETRRDVAVEHGREDVDGEKDHRDDGE